MDNLEIIDVSSIDVFTLDVLFVQLAKDCMMLEIVRANGLILLCGFLNNKAFMSSPYREHHIIVRAFLCTRGYDSLLSSDFNEAFSYEEDDDEALALEDERR
jgi:hypothetical protein